MRNIVIVLVTAAVAVFLAAGPAQAHSTLIGSTPGFDAVVDGSPEQVELVFNQTINPAFATVTVTDDGGVQRSGDEGALTPVLGHAESSTCWGSEMIFSHVTKELLGGVPAPGRRVVRVHAGRDDPRYRR